MTRSLPALTVRPIGPEDMEPVLHAVETAFGTDATPAAIASWSARMEHDRTYAIRDGDLVVGGGSVHSFALSVPGGSVPAGGLTLVGVLPTHRRRGALRALMRRVFDDGVARGEPLSVLWASEGAIYGRHGYGIATLRASFSVPRHQLRLTPPVVDHGSLRLLDIPTALRLLPPVWERLASLTPGIFSRSPGWWRDEALDDADWRRAGAGPRHIVALEVDGDVRGYALHRMRPEWDHLGSQGTLEVREVVAPDPAAELGLWRYLASMDLVATIKAPNVAVDTPLFHRVEEPRRLGLTVGDGLWLRLLDLRRALEARAWAVDDELVLEVSDLQVPAVAGRWRLSVRDGRARVERTDALPDVALGTAELASLYLGGIRAGDLARAGRLSAADPATPRRLDALHAVDRQPWCPAMF